MGINDGNKAKRLGMHEGIILYKETKHGEDQ